MANKNKLKKNLSKSENRNKTESDGDINKINDYNLEDAKKFAKELPFALISNKQFSKIGFEKEKVSKQVTTIPLKFPSKLMPTLKRIFGLGKTSKNEEQEHLASFDNLDESFVTLISFQQYVQHGHETNLSPLKLPILQIIQMKTSSKNTERKFSLYLSETNIKPATLNSFAKCPIPTIENNEKIVTKPIKKKSFLNEIWRKKSISCVESPRLVSNDVKLEGIDEQKQPKANDLDKNTCLLCGKAAFMAEKIQIGADVFHNSCFKCSHCSKCLYRGKWNKNQDQYFCDYCYKRILWPFIHK